MSESLIAATLNAASALGLSKDYGSLSRGKFADLVIIDAPRSEKLFFKFLYRTSHNTKKNYEYRYLQRQMLVNVHLL